MFGTEAWAMGRGGEQQVKDWLKRHGFSVISLADIADDGAPSLVSSDDRVILPDLQVGGDGHLRFVEVKTKSEATFHQNTQTWEHGIELRHYLAYLSTAQRTGQEAWLCVFEARRRLVLLQSVDHLHRVKREYRGPNAPKGVAFVYFPCDEFEWYHGPSQIKFKPITPRAVRTLQQPAPPISQGVSQLDLWKS